MIKSRFILYSSGIALALIGTVGASIAVGANKPALPSIGTSSGPKERVYDFKYAKDVDIERDGSRFSLPVDEQPELRFFIEVSSNYPDSISFTENPKNGDPLFTLRRPDSGDPENPNPWSLDVSFSLATSKIGSLAVSATAKDGGKANYNETETSANNYTCTLITPCWEGVALEAEVTLIHVKFDC